MKVLLVGSGGREDAMAQSIMKSSLLEKLYIAPGNGGSPCERVNIKALDIEGIVAFAKEKSIDLVIVGPESPLIKGMADELKKAGVLVFGCSKEAAQMEGSKIYAKKLMLENGIPTGLCEIFNNSKDAIDYINNVASQTGTPIVVKADGEAAGKGVVVTSDPSIAIDAVKDIMDNKIFGASGDNIIIEEYLDGQETTVLSFVDGENYYIMPPSQDHKRAFDGDKGPNTGGMGVYSPVPVFDEKTKEFVENNIIKKTLKALKDRGIHYKGVLYTGLALTSKGPKVVEFNVRFGDPETQVILPLMETDFLEVCYKTAKGELKDMDIKFKDKKAVSVVLASGGYPGSYEKGFEIKGIEEAEALGALVFHAGDEIKDGKLVTNGGRVLNVTCIGDDYKDCIDKVYKCVEKITWTDMFYRKDIAHRVL